MTDLHEDGPFAGLPRIEYEPDPFREKLLLALANADMQRWPSITENTTRHMAEMMYGEQADAVFKLLREEFDL